MEPIGSPETSAVDHITPRNNPEDKRVHLSNRLSLFYTLHSLNNYVVFELTNSRHLQEQLVNTTLHRYLTNNEPCSYENFHHLQRYITYPTRAVPCNFNINTFFP